jgi:hypothetical protein
VRWEALAEPTVAATLTEAGVFSAEDLASLLLLGPKEVAQLVSQVPPHEDDFPQVEYLSGRLLDREGSWLANFRLLSGVRCQRDPFAPWPGSWEKAKARRDQALARHLQELALRAASR